MNQQSINTVGYSIDLQICKKEKEINKLVFV